MAELNIALDQTPGIMKEIDHGAMELVFQAIQEDQYSFPIKSFVREAISNALDALVERDIHFAIKNGDPVEKYYRQAQDDALLKDSAYDPEYYNDKYLARTDHVQVFYEYPEETRKHLIRIVDNGVGLSGKRLQGFFKLGYSSKRNLKDVFGKFGAGAKAGLATGEDYFVMITRYNGFKTAFMIYKTDYEPITPKTEESKVESWTVKMTNGDTVTKNIYWEPTEESNGVEIQLTVKPHNRQKFIDAVRFQFQHFEDKIQMREQNPEDRDTYTYIGTYVDAHYETDNMIIPKWSNYHRPTIVLDGISYGTIAWNELELEPRSGSVAIKARSNDVDITQSRESLKWTEKTRKFVMQAVQKAEEEANDYLGSKLELTDPFNILYIVGKYNSISKGSDHVSNTLSKFLNRKNLKPRYTFNPDWFDNEKLFTINPVINEEFFYQLTAGLNIRKMTLHIKDSKVSLKGTKLKSFDEMFGGLLLYGDEKSLGPKLATHLLKKFNRDAIIYVRPGEPHKHPHTIEGVNINSADLYVYAKYMFKEYVDLNIDNYEWDKDNFEIDTEDSVIKVDKVTEAELRRKNKEILVHRYYSYGNTMGKHTVKLSEAVDWVKEHAKDNGAVPYIFTSHYRDMADRVKRWHGKVEFFMVATEYLSEFEGKIPFINEFFYTLEDNLLIPSQIIKDIIKRRRCIKLGQSLDIHVSRLAKFNDAIKDEIQWFSSGDTSSHYGSVNDFIKNVIEVYDVQQKDPDKALELAESHFGSKVIIDTLFDESILKEVKEEHERLLPIENILNSLPEYNLDKEIIKELELLLNIKTNTQCYITEN